MDTVDGVVIVRNDRRGLWAEGEEWTIQKAFCIGDESDPNGSVLDVFDPGGRYLGTLDLGEYDVPFVVRATIRRGGQ